MGNAMCRSNVGVWELDAVNAENRYESLRLWNVWQWLGYPERGGSSNFESFIDLVHPDDRMYVRGAFERGFSNALGVLEIEHRLLHRDGSHRWVLARGTMRRNSMGMRVCLSGTLVDITELKLAEQALRVSEERFRGTFENAAVGVAHCDSSGRFLRVNQRYCDIAGYTREQLLNMTFGDITDTDYVSASLAHFHLLKEGRISHYTEEKPLVRSDGSRIWINVCVSVQRDSSDQIIHSIAILQDISERKALEEAVRIAKDDAESANRAKDQFLANISHELRTPLNGILGYAQILHRDDTLDVRQKANVAVIEQSGNHLLTLINDLLDFARMGTGKIELQPEDILLAPFLELIAEIVGVRAREKGLAQTCVIAPCLPTAIRVDDKRLRQVLLNLLSNAVKFTDEGEVRFAVSQMGPGVLRFEVRDTGVGIRPSQLGRIFRPFEQAGDLERRSAGAGLGLAISQQLVRLMGSEIFAESHDGQGSRFWFDLAVPFPITGSCGAASGSSMRLSSSDALDKTTMLFVPAQQNMETLHRLALRGSMKDVIRHVESLLETDTRYCSFVSKVRRLAENYESQMLLSFIEEHLKGS
jgi:PAS domain S-box-containing protein